MSNEFVMVRWSKHKKFSRQLKDNCTLHLTGTNDKRQSLPCSHGAYSLMAETERTQTNIKW